MRVINVAAIMDEIFASEAGLGSPLQSIDFVHRNHADVYRVLAGGNSFIAHVSPHGTEYLKRLRANLETVAVLGDPRIPREVAWRKSNTAWAVLVCRELPGRELNASNATEEALTSLAELLLRLHSVDEAAPPPSPLAGQVNEPSAFPGFAEMLLRRLGDLPIRRERVRRHLDAMSAFLRDHVQEFRVAPRLIHGDLHRSNIVSTGSSVGLVDWADLTAGDYAYDLATLKFILDSVAPSSSTEFIRRRARIYRERFEDETLELRLRFFLALAGLVRAFHCADDVAAFRRGRAWRVRACYLHSETQWQEPIRLDGPERGAPPRKTEDWALDLRQPLRGIFYLLAPRRVS